MGRDTHLLAVVAGLTEPGKPPATPATATHRRKNSATLSVIICQRQVRLFWQFNRMFPASSSPSRRYSLMAVFWT